MSGEKLTPNPDALVREKVERDYIVLTQRPGYKQEAGWTNENEREAFTKENGLRFLRVYQERAVHKLQEAVAHGHHRFLFEMATGTGKTLTSAAVIKLFLRTRNANRVLFLVDRLELESQAKKAFDQLLKSDAKTVIFKENKDDWRHADIVVSTVQSFLFNNKYADLFSPTDFELVISDEAHRSIGGNARAVFEYFTGYKLGLTATPRDYLKKFDADSANDPREHERRQLLDTYRTFGCEDGTPTFRYSLLDGVRDGYGIALPERARRPGSYPVVGSNGIAGSHDEFLIQGPAIVIGRKGSAGEVTWIPEACTPIDTTFYVRIVDESATDPRFLYHILRTAGLADLRGGTGVPGLSRADVYALKSLPHPSIDEQRLLLAEIDKHEREIDHAKRAIKEAQAKIDAAVGTLWREANGDCEPGE